MERVRQIRDAIKNRYSKPCCIKVGVGVGLGLVVLVVVVVVAATMAGGGEDEGSGEVTSQVAPDTGNVSVTEPLTPQVTDWPHQFTVQLGSQGFSQILAIDDVTQRYVIEINSNQHFSLYIIVDFQKKQNVYVITEKGGNNDMGENRVLYCESSPFANDFNGLFIPSTTLREGGSTYREQAGGRTVSLHVAHTERAYRLSPTLVYVLQGSCQDIPHGRLFTWLPQVSGCGTNTTVPVASPVCSNTPCPHFETNSLSTQQACNAFRKCNYVMSTCDSSWTQPYDQRPYCVCRSTLLDDVHNINCPDAENQDGGGECALRKREIGQFEQAAACYCRYRISRIYPMMMSNSGRAVSWEIKATVRTAPINRHDHCPC